MAEYIEKEAVVHHFMTKRQYLTKDLVMDAAYEVSKFPAADVAAVVHGRWVNGHYDDEGLVCWCCSHCAYIDEDMSNYCPNCGARMDGE
jgi:Zn finger protein HypA/HybF involved in hydrogenase expression